MTLRCPHCHAIFNDDTPGWCCPALKQELTQLQRRSKHPARSLWLWRAQHTVDWVPQQWINISNMAAAPGHLYNCWCNCTACCTVRAARGFTKVVPIHSLKEDEEVVTLQKRELAVMLDAQGVSYLRLGESSTGSTLLVLNNGKSVDLIQMDKSTIKSRDLQVVNNANVLEGVKILLHPLNPNVIISKSAETELNKILSDKELVASMTPRTAVAPAATAAGPKPVKVGTSRGPKPAAVKTAKAAKTTKAETNGNRLNSETTFRVNEGNIPAKLRQQIDNPEKNSHGVVVLRYLLSRKKAENAETIIAGVSKTGKYKTDGKPDSLILGDLRILTKNGIVVTE